MRSLPIHEAVKQAYTRFEELTGEPAVKYIVERSTFCGSTVYQWSEAVGEDEAARRNISLLNAVIVTNILNQGYAEHGLPRDYTILSAANAATGALLFAVPEGMPIDTVVIPETLNEFNQFVQAYAHAYADGQIDKPDLARIRKEGGELIAAVLGMIEDAARREREPKNVRTFATTKAGM
jgi:hypothetical protein